MMILCTVQWWLVDNPQFISEIIWRTEPAWRGHDQAEEAGWRHQEQRELKTSQMSFISNTLIQSSGWHGRCLLHRPRLSSDPVEPQTPAPERFSWSVGRQGCQTVQAEEALPEGGGGGRTVSGRSQGGRRDREIINVNFCLIPMSLLVSLRTKGFIDCDNIIFLFYSLLNVYWMKTRNCESTKMAH